MFRLTLTAVALAISGAALAKLPPQDDAAKAKAAEAAAKAAWQGKVDAYQLCKVQDRVVAYYKKTAATRPAVAVPAAATVPVSAAAPTAGASAAAAAPTAKTPSNSPKPTPASAGGTPVAAAAVPSTPCADPGPFAFNPPAQTPLETSGAHSPAGNAAAPPSVRPESATMAPAGAATPQSKKP
jgi:hypothetical protein